MSEGGLTQSLKATKSFLVEKRSVQWARSPVNALKHDGTELETNMLADQESDDRESATVLSNDS